MSTPAQPAGENTEPISAHVLMRSSRVTGQSGNGFFGRIDSGGEFKHHPEKFQKQSKTREESRSESQYINQQKLATESWDLRRKRKGK
ncbi:hypothetical protein MTR_5g006880 [Medicago truncatula]|uniref:Uncharacterized protein n=1 Tax=Medicago truncatula TaxID=3880 RepID=G7K3T0_MEDTR|nr:hypothetical protein MTR_5g006880 [Medicago truncatula]